MNTTGPPQRWRRDVLLTFDVLLNQKIAPASSKYLREMGGVEVCVVFTLADERKKKKTTNLEVAALI